MLAPIFYRGQNSNDALSISTVSPIQNSRFFIKRRVDVFVAPIGQDRSIQRGLCAETTGFVLKKYQNGKRFDKMYVVCRALSEVEL
jgi:hypothetical protein